MNVAVVLELERNTKSFFFKKKKERKQKTLKENGVSVIKCYRQAMHRTSEDSYFISFQEDKFSEVLEY